MTTPNNERNASRRAKPWHAMDAGELREALANEMADWLAAGFFSRYRADLFNHYAIRAAKLAKISIDEVYRTLRADGLAILDDRGQQPHHIFRQ